MKKIVAAWCALLIIYSVTWPGAAGAQAADLTEPYCFPQTGQYLSGRFRVYWERNGGLYVFELPLTRVYEERLGENEIYQVQYFERTRFEYHPENPVLYNVLLRLLGNEITALLRTERPFQPKPQRNEEGYAYATPTQHNLHGGFLQFWQRFGGAQSFGYPLSEEFPEMSQADGKTYTVQYFERTRFEYHVEYAGSDAEVLLGLIGLERIRRDEIVGAGR